MIPNSGCHVHQPLLLFSGGRTEESADGGCLFSLWRTGARLAHLATRWHCSHKELWSQLHSSAVALRKSSRAEVGKGPTCGTPTSLDCRGLWILLHARCIKAVDSKRRKSVWFGSEISHLRHDTHRHTLAHVHVEDLLGLALVGVGSGFWAVVFAPAGQQMVSQPYLFLWCLRTGNVLSVETIEFWKLGNVTALPPCASLLFQLFFLCLTTEKNRSSSKRNELYFPLYKQKSSIWNLETRLQPRRLWKDHQRVKMD